MIQSKFLLKQRNCHSHCYKISKKKIRFNFWILKNTKMYLDRRAEEKELKLIALLQMIWQTMLKPNNRATKQTKTLILIRPRQYKTKILTEIKEWKQGKAKEFGKNYIRFLMLLMLFYRSWIPEIQMVQDVIILKSI